MTDASAPICREIDRTEDNTAHDDDADDDDVYLISAIDALEASLTIKAEPATPPLKVHCSIGQRAVKPEPVPFQCQSLEVPSR